MRFVLTIVTAVLVLHSLVFLGLIGFGLATGRFDAEKREQYLATWRGEKLVPPSEEAEQVVEEESPQQASARIAEAQTQREILNRELQRQLGLLRDMKITVEMAQQKLNKDLQELKAQQEAFAAKVAEQQRRAQEEGFRKALKNYSQMKPKYVVADFMKMDDTEVVRYVAAMKPDVATRILNQFRSPEEQAKRLRIMQLLEQQGAPVLNN